MASESPMIVLDLKFCSACLDGKLKTIIAIPEPGSMADTKLSTELFSVSVSYLNPQKIELRRLVC